MTSPADGALSLFHPLIREWFLGAVGSPTEVQERAWPEIARGSHVLVSAPTGTGKTLTAFLWGIDRLVTGALAPGKVRILYVSPLKALNNDIQRNLRVPLEQLTEVFRRAGAAMPPVRVLTRSGDTPSAERQRMARHPPEILITTPESLNLILSSPNSRLMLDGVSVVILDEIHAVAATKRGTHLVTAVDRLVRLSGDFQRIALSATVKPLSAVADLVGGYVMERAGGEPVYRKRPVTIVHCPMAKEYDLTISFPAADLPPAAGPGGAPAPGLPRGQGAARPPSDEPVFDALARECRKIIAGSRSTLFFVNSRRHAEKLARFINEGQPEPLAWSHHGSLSRELRLVVEQRLKQGELKAIVATSSLELGIDIGALDRVILVSTPFSVASAVQRLGRAGHRVGETSRGVLFPLHGKDIIAAAVTARCVREQDIDAIAPVTCPLDVLAQVVVSMTSVETWRADDLFDFIRAGFPYHELPRRHFDLVLDMLAGKYQETRLRDLAPMISYDRLDSTLRAKEGARLRLAMSGGTIPDRGYFSLRTADSNALIGELDEEFVWERSLGDTFVFGTQGWRIMKMDHQNVHVVPVETRIGMSPFWKAEERNRAFHISERIAAALEDWTGRLRDPGFAEDLSSRYGMEEGAARALVAFLARQREATGADLPHRHLLLVEHTRDPSGKAEGANIILHTMWGGRVNRPFSLALSAAWEERWGERPEIYQGDDAILLFLAEDRPAAEIVTLVEAAGIERLLRRRLEGSGFFGARFRESAGRALLLPRASARRRTPLWLTRQRAKSLFSAVSGYDDFPLLLEAWRTCLRDEFDLDSLRMVLGELAAGEIRVAEVSTPVPSPFCDELLWKRTNNLMYQDDTPPGAGGTSLRGDLVREIALSTDLRPRLPAAVRQEFQLKAHRTAEGYAPRDARELLDWVKERVVLPREEWTALLAACQRDHGLVPALAEEALREKLVEAPLGPDGVPCVTAREVLPRIERALAPSGDDEKLAGLLSEWLRSYGPVQPGWVCRVFGIPRARLDALLEDLVEEEQVVLDRLADGSEDLLLCDRENLEILLRISRARARPAVRSLPVEHMPAFVARRQGVNAGASGPDELKGIWEKLLGLALPARAWEEEVFPARMKGYTSRWMDGLLSESGLLWIGCGKQKVAFCFGQDIELFLEGPTEPEDLEAVFPGPGGRYTFWELLDHAGEASRGAGGKPRSSAELAADLWDLAWKGLVSTDSFVTVRRGIENGFRAKEAARGDGGRRRGFDRWQASRPVAGRWFRIDRGQRVRDAMDEEELTRDRIRQVLQRYGVIFREILENELPPLRWSRLFRSLRTMEFSGEVVTGRFFEGVPGVQFALPSIAEELAAAGTSDDVWWTSATDPASLCGVDIEGLKAMLPARLPTTHVVFQGNDVVLVSRRRGFDLEFRVPPDSPRLAEYLDFMKTMTTRDQQPLRAVRVETVNGEPVGTSPYKARLLELGFAEDYRRLTWRARP